MSFTLGNIAGFEEQLKAIAGALMSPQQVDLYGGGSVNIKLHVGSRRATEDDITGGAVSDSNMVATIDADDWDAKAGREPQKGDVIHWAEKRWAVNRSAVSAPGGNKVFYKARLEG